MHTYAYLSSDAQRLESVGPTGHDLGLVHQQDSDVVLTFNLHGNKWQSYSRATAEALGSMLCSVLLKGGTILLFSQVFCYQAGVQPGAKPFSVRLRCCKPIVQKYERSFQRAEWKPICDIDRGSTISQVCFSNKE